MKKINKQICEHCGKSIELDRSTGLWFHQNNRWYNDNGYFCYHDSFKISADPIKNKNMRIKFNVAEITTYGSGGGTKVLLFPSIDNEISVQGSIVLHFIEEECPFKLGEYYIEVDSLDEDSTL